MPVTVSGWLDVFWNTTPKAMLAKLPMLVAFEPSALSVAPAPPRLRRPLSAAASVPLVAWRFPSGVLLELMPANQPGMVLSSTHAAVAVPNPSKLWTYVNGPLTEMAAVAGVANATDATAIHVSRKPFTFER